MADEIMEAYISVGSNINPEKNIAKALDYLKEHAKITAISTFYQTRAIDRPKQPDFVNGIFKIQTDMPARELKFDVLRKIESGLGRIHSDDKYIDRTIDLDIVIYGDMVIDEFDLKIPDRDIRRRPFIAIPLLEIEPSLILPDTGEKLSSLGIIEAKSDMKPVFNFSEMLREGIFDEP